MAEVAKRPYYAFGEFSYRLPILCEANQARFGLWPALSG
jgi:hypothetical protein